MKLTSQEAERMWDFALCMKIDAKFLEFCIMEKLPKKVNLPILNNHIRKLKDAAQGIAREAAYFLTVQKEDYQNDHAYALYRIYDVLRTAGKDELEKIGDDLSIQQKEVAKLSDPVTGDLHQELMRELYTLDSFEDKKRVLNLVRKIKKEKEKKLEVA